MFSLALKPPVFRSPKWLGITNQSLCWEFTVGSLHIIEIIISKWYTFYIHMYITIYKEIYIYIYTYVNIRIYIY
jgi:hypothetical protein